MESTGGVWGRGAKEANISVTEEPEPPYREAPSSGGGEEEEEEEEEEWEGRGAEEDTTSSVRPFGLNCGNTV